MLENEGVALRAIRWSEIFPWLGIGRCFRLAVTLRLLVFGAAAVLLTLVGWWTIARVFGHDDRLNPSWSEAFGEATPWTVIDRSVAWRLGVQFPGVFDHSNVAETAIPGGPSLAGPDPVTGPWKELTRPAWRVFADPGRQPYAALGLRDLLSLLVSALWSLAVWAYFGAAISRVAAVQLASGERVGWGAALRWASSKWGSYFAAPLFPMLGVAVAVVPLFVLGLLMKWSFTAALVGLAWPVVLVGGFAMTVLLAGVLLGWPLMWATISAEGTDSFDALSRTYAYVFQRPLRYLFYVVVAAVLGWLGWIVVENFAAAVTWLAAWAASWGSGAERMGDLLAKDADGIHAYSAGAIIGFWTGGVKLLVLGYAYAYFAVSTTAIYFLLRRDVDATETDEVFQEADESEKSFGLPPVVKDERGAPQVETPAATAAATAAAMEGEQE